MSSSIRTHHSESEYRRQQSRNAYRKAQRKRARWIERHGFTNEERDEAREALRVHAGVIVS